MKCVQKSCQRSKNILANGYCNVCKEVVEETTANLRKKFPLKQVEVNFKDLVATHEKLKKGESVDHKIVSGLTLGGVINILAQHDSLENLETRIDALEKENKTNKTRIESLESWTNKQEEEIKKLTSTIKVFDGNEIKENIDVENLKEKVTSLEARMLGGGKLLTNRIVRKKSKSCHICDKIFDQNCDYEKHMEEHQIEKKYKCDKCGKMFHLEWRLRKHLTIHNENGKYCHYFNNQKQCPFEEIGCKLLHIRSERCKFQDCKNNLCQFSHR